jgi:hypothetical protein
VLEDTTACVQVEHSILGTVLVLGDEVGTDPVAIHLADSIVDATDRLRQAISAPDCRHAHADLHIQRTTVIGEVHVHAVVTGQDSIFDGRVHVARRGIGCLRFCAVPPGTAAAPVRTPRRYRCQPDLAFAELRELADSGHIDATDLPRLRGLEAARLRPRFTGMDYGTPAYGQLAAACAPEISRGAEDHSELGVFHDLYQPQRADNLRARLAEFAPAGTDAAIVVVS